MRADRPGATGGAVTVPDAPAGVAGDAASSRPDPGDARHGDRRPGERARPGAGAPWRQRTAGSRRGLQLAAASVALLALVAAIGAVALRHLATDEALNDARSVTVAFSRGVLRDAVTPGVLRGDPEAVARLDRTVREDVLGHPIVRVKVWALDGRIVYSDARPLIGTRFAMPDDLRDALADGAVRAEVSDLSRPENRFERGRGRLVEVYLPLRLRSGQRVMVETYRPASSIDAASSRIWRTFLPMLLALLAALAVVQLPVVWAQSRRERAVARERERFAQERERLARETEESLRAERGGIATSFMKASFSTSPGPRTGCTRPRRCRRPRRTQISTPRWPMARR